MKIPLFSSSLLVAFCLLASSSIFSQEIQHDSFGYQIASIYPPFSVTTDQVEGAETLEDLNRFYKESWVRSHLGVELTTTRNGQSTIVKSGDGRLSHSQKKAILSADFGTEISIVINYIPENSLPIEEEKQHNWSFVVRPTTKATYPAGDKALYTFLKEKLINQLPPEVYVGYELTSAKFTVEADGSVSNVYFVDDAPSDKLNELFVKTICSMEAWNPARFANGEPTKQEMVLNVGNLANCNIYTLGIQ